MRDYKSMEGAAFGRLEGLKGAELSSKYAVRGGARNVLVTRGEEHARAETGEARKTMVGAGNRLIRAGLYNEAYKYAGALKKRGQIEASKAVKERIRRTRRR